VGQGSIILIIIATFITVTPTVITIPDKVLYKYKIVTGTAFGGRTRRNKGVRKYVQLDSKEY
tara:strand:- start:1655 stop:1840 length:186 start_codon:yes stop_codon:yes gene_type:complete